MQQSLDSRSSKNMNDNFAYCMDCKRYTEVVIDHASGDTICTNCGLILEDHFIDETCEWRTFADTKKDNNDPHRVGSAANPFLTYGNLSTTITKSNNVGTSDINNVIFINSKVRDIVNPDKALIKGFETISTMADRLGIVKTAKIKADEIYKNLVEKKACKGKNLKAILAACLFIACKESKLARTVKEMCLVEEGISRKKINRSVVFIKKQIEVDSCVGLLNVSGPVRRYCSILAMTNQAIKVVEETLDKSKEFDIRRSPNSVLAAIIFLVTQFSDHKIHIRDIAMATQVAEQTIKKTYKDIYPYASRIIPRWYAEEDKIKKLQRPN